MSWYSRLFFPLLRRMDAERAHEMALLALAYAQRGWPGKQILHRIAGPVRRGPIKLFGLTFPHELGLAAGFDKDVRAVAGLAALGFGHIEVGTLTPKPQIGNPRPRIFRLPADSALINRMGFPNGGVEAAVPRLKALSPKKRDYVLGVSLGKQKETPLAEAAGDYLTVMEAVYSYADYLAVNISSPNTPGLRDLQGGDYLGQLLGAIQAGNEDLAKAEERGKRPLLVKISPDLSWPELDEILTAVTDHQIDGIIATNTTLSRQGLTHQAREEEGGMSGRPLRERSDEIIRYIHRQTEGKLPIIGVGGVRTVADVRAKLDAGASLVQLYTGLVYEGPGLPGRILRQIA